MRSFKIGRFGIKADTPVEQPSVQPTPVQTPTPNKQDTSIQNDPINQQNNDVGQNTSTQTDPNNNPSVDSKEPKKKLIFQDLKDHVDDTIVFSSMRNVRAYQRIKDIDNIRWEEVYTPRLPKKENFYRFEGIDKDTNDRKYFLLLRGDVPRAGGLYRVVIDRFGHRGQAHAKYFNDINSMLNFVNRQYGIDTDQLKFDLPDPKEYVQSLVDSIKQNGASSVGAVFSLDVGSQAENKELVETIFNTALDGMKTHRAVDVINKIDKLEKKHFPVDIDKWREMYKKHKLTYEDNKEKYKKMFDEDVPFHSRDKKVMEGIRRLEDASKNNNKFYRDMYKKMKLDNAEIFNRTNDAIVIDDIHIGGKPIQIPAKNFIVVPSEDADKSEKLKELEDIRDVSVEKKTGLYTGDIAEYLRKMNAYNENTMYVVEYMSNSRVRNTFELQNKSDMPIRDKDITIPPKGSARVSKQVLQNSPAFLSALKSGDLVIPKNSIQKQWKGFVSVDDWKRTMDYFRESLKQYERYQGKPVKPFEHKLRMYTDPNVGWRNITPDSTFRAELDMGDVYVPAPKDYINNKSVNEHFSDTECIAFSYVHEQFVDGKKVWIIDEYQSDMVQQVDKMNNNPLPPSYDNPKGKSPKQLYRNKVENFYGDWYRVLLNKIIKKAKEFGVDEIWLIKGSDIFNYWHQRGAFGNLTEDQINKKMKLFRRVYDSTAIEYAQQSDDPKTQDLLNRYNQIVKDISIGYDMLDRLKQYKILNTPVDKMMGDYPYDYHKYYDLTPEQRQQKLNEIDIDKVREVLNTIDIMQLKKELEDITEQVSVIRKKPKELPPEIYNGRYHVIDVEKIPDTKIASRRRQQITSYASRVVISGNDYQTWKETGYDWVVNQWMPSYEDLARKNGEQIIPKDQQYTVGLAWFWDKKLPRELKTDEKFLVELLEYMRERAQNPSIEYPDSIKFYIEGKSIGKEVTAGDNPDPSYVDPQTSPMEENFDNRSTNPDGILYRKQKGRGAPYGDPRDGGELKTNLPASMITASDIVERYMITREKQHASEPEIREELEEKGVSDKEVEQTYQTRDKNLYKEVQ